MKKNNIDFRQRFLFEDYPVRGVYVDLSNSWQYSVHLKEYPPNIQNLLGELLAAAVLLSSTIKFKGQLILQLQGNGYLNALVAEATSYHSCRATVRLNYTINHSESENIRELLGAEAVFVMTLQPEQGEIWQSIIPLDGNNIAEILTHYMNQSEQLASYFQFKIENDTVKGLLLQRLPSDDEALAQENWETIYLLAQSLKDEELVNLSLAQLLRRLFNQYSIRIFAEEDFYFSCNCSNEKTKQILLMLGENEIKEILTEQGSVQFCCDYCGKKYVYDVKDINAIFQIEVMQSVKH